MSVTVNPINIARAGQRAERKMLITVAEWVDTNGNITHSGSSTKYSREILGTRTEDSSIEYNADVQQSTDILGHNYTDLNKTQPQQDFDPYLILGGSKLGAKLNAIRANNALAELDQFNIYIITLFINGTGANTAQAEVHAGCTITYNSIGGDANVNMPISVYLSNNSNVGYVNLNAKGGVDENFTFTGDIPMPA